MSSELDFIVVFIIIVFIIIVVIFVIVIAVFVISGFIFSLLCGIFLRFLRSAAAPGVQSALIFRL